MHGVKCAPTRAGRERERRRKDEKEGSILPFAIFDAHIAMDRAAAESEDVGAQQTASDGRAHDDEALRAAQAKMASLEAQLNEANEELLAALSARGGAQIAFWSLAEKLAADSEIIELVTKNISYPQALFGKLEAFILDNELHPTARKAVARRDWVNQGYVKRFRIGLSDEEFVEACRECDLDPARTPREQDDSPPAWICFDCLHVNPPAAHSCSHAADCPCTTDRDDENAHADAALLETNSKVTSKDGKLHVVHTVAIRDKRRGVCIRRSMLDAKPCPGARCRLPRELLLAIVTTVASRRAQSSRAGSAEGRALAAEGRRDVGGRGQPAGGRSALHGAGEPSSRREPSAKNWQTVRDEVDRLEVVAAQAGLWTWTVGFGYQAGMLERRRSRTPDEGASDLVVSTMHPGDPIGLMHAGILCEPRECALNRDASSSAFCGSRCTLLVAMTARLLAEERMPTDLAERIARACTRTSGRGGRGGQGEDELGEDAQGEDTQGEDAQGENVGRPGRSGSRLRRSAPSGFDFTRQAAGAGAAAAAAAAAAAGLHLGGRQAGNAQPGSAQPGGGHQRSAQPGSGQERSAQPGSAQERSAQERSAQPGSAQQGSAQQGNAQHGSAQPGGQQLNGQQSEFEWHAAERRAAVRHRETEQPSSEQLSSEVASRLAQSLTEVLRASPTHLEVYDVLGQGDCFLYAALGIPSAPNDSLAKWQADRNRVQQLRAQLVTNSEQTITRLGQEKGMTPAEIVAELREQRRGAVYKEGCWPPQLEKCGVYMVAAYVGEAAATELNVDLAILEMNGAQLCDLKLVQCFFVEPRQKPNSRGRQVVETRAADYPWASMVPRLCTQAWLHDASQVFGEPALTEFFCELPRLIADAAGDVSRIDAVWKSWEGRWERWTSDGGSELWARLIALRAAKQLELGVLASEPPFARKLRVLVYDNQFRHFMFLRQRELTAGA